MPSDDANDANEASQQVNTSEPSVPERMRTEHARLEALLASIGEEQFVQPGTLGAWSVKDMLAHITFWEQRLVAFINGARESLIRPDEDEETGTDRINAEVFAANRDRPLAEVRDDFARSYQQVLALAESLSPDDLADESFFYFFGGDTFAHYREHIEMLEQWEH